MSFKKKGAEQEFFLNYKKPDKRYSEFELAAFDRELEQYRIETTLRNGQKGRVVDTKAFLVAKGAITPEGALVIENLKRGEAGGYDCSPIRYEALQDKLDQWMKWKARNDFGKSKGMEDAAEAAGYPQP